MRAKIIPLDFKEVLISTFKHNFSQIFGNFFHKTGLNRYNPDIWKASQINALEISNRTNDALERKN
ncbi:hypothetical protein HZS_5030 [Henneguya salminicola]|nr:hypothetical protein HZS_5030 [Henneguya salminicola]